MVENFEEEQLKFFLPFERGPEYGEVVNDNETLNKHFFHHDSKLNDYEYSVISLDCENA